PNGVPVPLIQPLDTRTHPPVPRLPDEHHLELNRTRVEPHRAGRLERLALASVGVSLDGDVDQPERELPGALDLAGHDDEAGARSEDRLTRAVELLQRGHEIPRVHELEQGRGLTTRHDEPIDPVELDRLAYLDRLDAAFLERPGVKREVALEGEHTDPHTDSPRLRLALPPARLQEILLRELRGLDTDHGLAQILAHTHEHVGILEMRGGLHDGLGALGGVARLEDPGADEHRSEERRVGK